MPITLDSYDKRILDLLQEDASLSTAEIAERVGLSQSPCWRSHHSSKTPAWRSRLHNSTGWALAICASRGGNS